MKYTAEPRRSTIVTRWVLTALLIITPVQWARAQVGGVATAAALQQAYKEGVNKAVAEGDYLLGKALIDGLTLLEAWEKANSTLINTAFKELDGSQYAFFQRLQSTLQEAQTGVAADLEKLNETLDEAYQLAADSVFVSDRVTVLRYSPSVVAVDPLADDTVHIRVRGLGLSDAFTTLKIGDIERAPDSATLQEQLFIFPGSVFRVDAMAGGKTILANYRAETRGWFRRYTYKTTLAFRSLPKRFAHYKLTVTSTVAQREYSPVVSFEKSFKARKDTARWTQSVTKGAGWLIDPATIKLQDLAGEKCDGPKLEGVPTPAGFVVSVKCGEIKKTKWEIVKIGPLKTKAKPEFYWTGGWKNVRLSWQEYQTIPKTVEREIEGDLLFGEEQLVDIPEAETAAVAGTLTTSSGKQYVIDGVGRAGPVSVELLKSSGKLAFRAMRLE